MARRASAALATLSVGAGSALGRGLLLRALSQPLPRRRLRLALMCVAFFLTLSSIFPDPALAWGLPSPSSIIDSFIKHVFGVDTHGFTGTFFLFLITIPDYTAGSASFEGLEHKSAAIALAILSAIVCLSAIHYWASGLSMSGGNAGISLEAALRCCGVALFIVSWPWIFHNGAALANNVTNELVPHDRLDVVVTATVGALGFASLLGPQAAGISIVIGVILLLAGVLLVLALVMTKIVLSAALATLFVVTPLAVVWWPIPGLTWPGQYVLRTYTGILFVGVAWGACLAVSATLGTDFMTFSGGGAWVGKIVKPCVALAELFLMVQVPGHVMRAAGAGGGGGGAMSHVVGGTVRTALSSAMRAAPRAIVGGLSGFGAGTGAEGGAGRHRAVAGGAEARGQAPRGGGRHRANAGGGRHRIDDGRRRGPGGRRATRPPGGRGPLAGARWLVEGVAERRGADGRGTDGGAPSGASASSDGATTARAGERVASPGGARARRRTAANAGPARSAPASSPARSGAGTNTGRPTAAAAAPAARPPAPQPEPPATPLERAEPASQPPGE